MQFDVKQALAAALTVGMFVMLLNMIGNGPLNFSSPEEMALMAAGDAEVMNTAVESVPHDDTPKYLWGKPGPVLQPCWNKHITGRQGKTWGYVIVILSSGPQYHPLQVAEAVLVARYLGATLLLPVIKEAVKEPNSDFDKIYDVNNFISSLKDVVRVVGRLPEDIREVKPMAVKIPYRVTPEYIEEKVSPIFKQSAIIQLTTVFSASSLQAMDTSDKEAQAIRCVVTYSALQFHSQVQKLGDRIISRVREGGEAAGGRFIAVDLRMDALKQKGCVQLDNSKSKKCFDGQDVGIFLKRLGFSSSTAIYITQSRWDASLDPLKDNFPNVFTKEYSMPFNEEKQILYSGNSPFEKAIDFYICTHSDVFVPAISGVSYVSVTGVRIANGNLQILVPRAKEDDNSKLKVSSALSKFVTTKGHSVHSVHSCFCKSSLSTSKEKR